MYCKIKMTCKLCKCSAEIEAEKFQAPGRFICQNCGQTMPKSIYAQLAAAMDSLANISEDTSPDGWEYERENGFLLSVSGKADSIFPNLKLVLDE